MVCFCSRHSRRYLRQIREGAGKGVDGWFWCWYNKGKTGEGFSVEWQPYHNEIPDGFGSRYMPINCRRILVENTSDIKLPIIPELTATKEIWEELQVLDSYCKHFLTKEHGWHNNTHWIWDWAYCSITNTLILSHVWEVEV